jgi:hypothetical protein
VVATVKGGVRFSGILSAATSEGEISLALRQAQLVDDPQAPLKPSLLIQARDLQELQAVDISLEHRPAERDAFKTDVDITGVASDRREKELQAWGAPSGGGGGIEDGIGGMALDDERANGKHGAWDQFATNERLYGTRTDYHEELYTTQLDRTGADYRAREQRAAQLEREIMKVGLTRACCDAECGADGDCLYRAVEELLPVTRTWLRSEESLTTAASTRRIGTRPLPLRARSNYATDHPFLLYSYSSVIRGPDAYVPPGARKGPLARFGIPANGISSPSPPSPSAQGKPAQDPAIVSTSRLPVYSSGNSRISLVPSASEPPAPVTSSSSSKSQPTLEGDFRNFVSHELERLTQKKQAIVKAAEKQDKDSKLASLLEFSQTFKVSSAARFGGGS